MIVGIISIISAIVNIIAGAGVLDMEGLPDKFDVGYIIVAIGSLIAAVLYFKFGGDVRSGAVSGKVTILATFVKVVGIVTIISGIFTIIGGAISEYFDPYGGIITLIFGLIIYYCGTKIDDGKQTTGDKIIWVLLLIAFVLEIIGSLIMCIAFPIGTITGICGLIIYIYMLMLLFDPEVKSAMNM